MVWVSGPGGGPNSGPGGGPNSGPGGGPNSGPGGAAGKGAVGHASPHMAHALGVARDSIVGYWDANDKGLKTARKPKDVDSLDYLSGTRRFEVLLGEVLSEFKVAPESYGASLACAGQEICKIKKPSSPQLKKQMIWVRNYADLRGDRIAEITEQAEAIIPFFGSVGLLNDSRRKHTWEMLSMVQSICIMLEMRIKHYCWSPRPIDFAEEVQPIIQTPDHSTYPSGHATEAFALSTVLYHLMNKTRAKDYDSPVPPMTVRVAHRIAVNRTVAGVHFPTDSAAGAMLGTAIGEAVIALGIGAKLSKKNYGFDTPPLGDDDFVQKWYMTHHKGVDGPKVKALPLFKRAYDRAKAEW